MKGEGGGAWARATSRARLRRAGGRRGAHRCGHLTNHGDARSAAAASACRCMWAVPSQPATASERDPKAGTMKRCAWREVRVGGEVEMKAKVEMGLVVHLQMLM